MATPNYKPLLNSSENLKALLAEQNAEGITSAVFSGNEPIDVLSAKTIFNASKAATESSVTSITAGTGISVSASTGSVTISSTVTGTLPTQTGNSGKLLTTDGTNASWTTTPAVTSLTGVAGSNLTLTAGSGNQGVVIVGTGSGQTASAVNTGGLRSANFGLSTALGGASYFGGAFTTAGTATVNGTRSSGDGLLQVRDLTLGTSEAQIGILAGASSSITGTARIGLTTFNSSGSAGATAEIQSTHDSAGNTTGANLTFWTRPDGGGAIIQALKLDRNQAATFAGAVTTGGALAITASGQAGAKATITNTDAASYSHLDLSSSSGQNSALYQFGSTYATAGRYVQGSMMLEAGGSGGLNLATSAATPIRFYTNGDNVRLAIASDGAATFAGAVTAQGLFYPQQATTAGAPAYVKGAIYFDTTLNKLRVGGASAWETITSS